MDIIEQLRREWPVIKQAPLLFAGTLMILIVVVGLVEYYFFKANLDRKDDLIKTLQAQLATMPLSVSQAPPPVQKANFHLSISGGNVFTPEAPDVRDRLTGIAINAKVWNTGNPSVATEWGLAVIPKGQIPVVAQLTTIPDQLRLGGPYNSVIIRSSDALNVKTAKEPIVNPIDGTLLFYVKLQRSVVLDAATQVELSVKDIYGSETVVRQLMGNWLQR
jgi:hypothetical protein